MKPHEVTQGTTDALLGPRQNILPMDDHDATLRTCVRCGRRGHYPQIHRTILRELPDEVSMACTDIIGCLRRRHQARTT